MITNYILLIGLIVFIVVLLVVFTIYTSLSTPKQPDLNNSENTLQRVNSVMKSHFGKNWPILFIIFAIIILLIIGLMVSFTSKGISINISENTGNKIVIIGAILMVFISIIVILTFLNYLLKNRNDTQKEIDNKKKFLTMAGIIIGCIFLISFIILKFV